MNNWADKIIKNFTYRSKSDLTNACEIDLDAIAEQLLLQEKAELAADNGLPMHSATKPDSTELEVQSYFANRMASINRIVNEGLCLRNTSITDTNLQD